MSDKKEKAAKPAKEKAAKAAAKRKPRKAVAPTAACKFPLAFPLFFFPSLSLIQFLLIHTKFVVIIMTDGDFSFFYQPIVRKGRELSRRDSNLQRQRPPQGGRGLPQP